jgi:hypothetical protein
VTNIPGFTYGQMSNGSNDLRFTDVSKLTNLNYEIDTWNPGGNSTLWLNVPLLANSNTSVYAFWGNENATVPASQTNGSVWDTNVFVAVWHLNELTNGLINNFRDSTTFQWHSTNQDVAWMPSQMVGQVGYGQYFECNSSGNGTNITFPANTFIGNAIATNYTFSMWAKSPFGTNVSNTFISRSSIGSLNQSLTNVMRWRTGTIQYIGPGGICIITSNTWNMLAWQSESLQLGRVFANGLGSTNFVITNSPSLSAASIFSLGGLVFLSTSAGMDEVRISRIAQSSNWLWASWSTVASNAANANGFASYSTASLGRNIRQDSYAYLFQPNRVDGTNYVFDERVGKSAIELPQSRDTVVWLKMDEATNITGKVVDSSYVGTNVFSLGGGANSPTWTTLNGVKCYSFDGGDYLIRDWSVLSNWTTIDTNRSGILWVKTTAFSSDFGATVNCLLNEWANNEITGGPGNDNDFILANNLGYSTTPYVTNSFYIYNYFGSTNYASDAHVASFVQSLPKTNEWHCIGYSVQSTNVALYLDGVLQVEASREFTGVNPQYLGHRWQRYSYLGARHDAYFHHIGYMKHFAEWRTALSSNEQLQAYQATSNSLAGQ